MGISNLKDKVSSNDLDAFKKNRNKAFEDGFAPSDGKVNLDEDDIDFGDIEFEDGGIKNSLGTANNLLGGPQSGVPFNGQQGGLPFGDPLGSGQDMRAWGTPQPAKHDVLEKVMSVSGAAVVDASKAYFKLIKGIKARTLDDWGIFSRNLLFTSGGLLVTGGVLGLLGLLAGSSLWGFTGIPLDMIIAGAIGGAESVVVLELTGYLILSHGAGTRETEPANTESTSTYRPASVPYAISGVDGDEDIEFEEDYANFPIDGEDDEDDIEAMYQQQYGDSNSKQGGSNSKQGGSNSKQGGSIFDQLYNSMEPEPESAVKANVNFDDAVAGIAANAPVVNRAFLVSALLPMFRLNTPTFADRRVLNPDSDEFVTMQVLALKALAAAAKKDFNEIGSQLDSVVETLFCYELRLSRVKGLTNLDAIANEFVAYFRESSADSSVSASVDLEGDFYKIVLLKGTNAIITLGDAFRVPGTKEFFQDESISLPFLAGITAEGGLLLRDAAKLDSMLIAGKSRSGKSWATFSLLMQLIAFNLPTEVQVLIIDPKKSAMLSTMRYLPHVCGVHDDTHVLEVLRDVVSREGDRRKAILQQSNCDTYKELYKMTGTRMPVLCVLIDEVVTIKNNLGKDKAAEFNELMQTIMTQFPYIGIKLIIIPHRATGIVDKTSRTIIGYYAALRAEDDVIKETLGIKKFDARLLNPGDMAVKMVGDEKAYYAKNPAITIDDVDNKRFTIALAKAFYKMGVEIPNMSSIGCGYNRNEKEIQRYLQSESMGRTIQY